MAALTLARLLADPARALSVRDWAGVLEVAHAERLTATLAARLDRDALPAAVARVLTHATMGADAARARALWEVECARRTLLSIGVPCILLKGSAYVAAGQAAGVGRLVGDLDILVPKAAIDRVEAALLAAGWEWVKPDPYDDAYYRRWMHELPPLIHKARDAMVDVHHTILPMTARPRPDAAALIADAVPIAEGLAILSPADQIVHAAAHLIADGAMDGAMRNLWDIDRLAREHGLAGVDERAARHGLAGPVARALRLAGALYETPGVDTVRRSDRAFLRVALARDGWGVRRHPATRAAFYLRSHWMRMPPFMLARHLWVKARRA